MKKITVCLIFILIITLNGCVEKRVQKNNSRDYLSIAVDKLPEDLALTSSESLSDKDLLRGTFSGLVKTDEEGNIMPDLAESYSVSKDGLVYTFKLRPALWSSGEIITADDCVQFFSYILKEGGAYVKELFSIKGAENYNKGIFDFKDVSIKAVSSNRLQITLNKPKVNFLNVLTQSVFTIRLGDYLKDYKASYGKMIFSGPYVINKIDKDSIELKKNDFYWNSDEIKVSKIVFLDKKNSEGALASFQAGTSDLMINPPSWQIPELKNKGEYFVDNNFITTSLNFNLTKKNITSDIDYRSLIQNALKLEDITKGIDDNDTSVETFLNASNLDSKLDLSSINSSLDKSLVDTTKRVLAKWSKKDLSISFIYIDDNKNEIIASQIGKELKDLNKLLGLNIKLTLKASNLEEESISLKKGEYDIYLNDYINEYSSSLCNLYKFTSSSPFNLAGYKSKSFDDLFLKAEGEENKSIRETYENNCLNILKKDLPIIPIYLHGRGICKTNELVNLSFDSDGNIDFNKLYYVK
ncbi:MAG TPA: ABC transporter substrate-binding protein [Clostridiaceae bacterium]